MSEPLTSLVGRENEIAAISALLHEPRLRLLTLTGPGGVGTTRLAVEVAARLESGFPDGVVFIEVASVHEAALLLPVAGKTDREIGDALSISHRTAMRHVCTIYHKLSVNARAAALRRNLVSSHLPLSGTTQKIGNSPDARPPRDAYHRRGRSNAGQRLFRTSPSSPVLAEKERPEDGRCAT